MICEQCKKKLTVYECLYVSDNPNMKTLCRDCTQNIINEIQNEYVERISALGKHKVTKLDKRLLAKIYKE